MTSQAYIAKNAYIAQTMMSQAYAEKNAYMVQPRINTQAYTTKKFIHGPTNDGPSIYSEKMHTWPKQ